MEVGWEWSNLLLDDFSSIDGDAPSLPSEAAPYCSDWDALPLPSEDPQPQSMPQPEPSSATSSVLLPHSSPLNPQTSSPAKVRKRDPRLTCSNFLTGHIPCACPELDEQERDEDEASRKRTKMTAAAVVRCQVTDCEADISELKGYHRRHRVCLRCANATTVILDGQPKRYCQQCGKFHVLQDFDEGKRSCRRKLERHNNRRRRKNLDFRHGVEGSHLTEKEPLSIMTIEDVFCNGEAGSGLGDGCGEASLHLSDQMKDTNTRSLLECEEGHESPFHSVMGKMNPSLQNPQSDDVLSIVTSDKAQRKSGNDHSRPSLSSSLCDNQAGYSSVCPTGRISFKLYDWNPAEFPRRLRHQIFQWLASMPVELEAYIRPGCTILTVFIAMPHFMWEKLFKDATVFLDDLVNAPGSLLSGRGRIFIYLNNWIFQVLRGGTSLANNMMDMRVPKLHYVHPVCFQAGKPMEFVACGRNLFQNKFRFLVSFAGKYLQYDSCQAISLEETKSFRGIGGSFIHCSDTEMFKIRIPSTDPKLFGPVFIEVENVSGISNFIPVLLGDKWTCSELQNFELMLGEAVCHEYDNNFVMNAACRSSNIADSDKKCFSELLLDIAWLLKEPHFDHDRNETELNSMHFERWSCLLRFLVRNGLVFVLEKVLKSPMVLMKLEESENQTSDVDMRLFRKYVNQARELVDQQNKRGRLRLRSKNITSQGSSPPTRDINANILNDKHCTNQEMGSKGERDHEKSIATYLVQGGDMRTPLLSKEVVMRVNHSPCPIERPRFYPSAGIIVSPRLFLIVLGAVVMCCGVCIVLRHPHEVWEFSISLRRCLTGTPKR
ncbi:squamosa promoter-binding-like protein 7 [Amborella trichopoda]|uniref:SBP-type domain-containing protein n=1 Tax=Amborella trichopoda TaxID=13333 RepID=U5DDJ1_AMBTC|nr:squamosa promoter-binding-like protein 7 [Amborella trichopoda]ERN18478.1 hypothetical protein AMTR_s00197p00030350 [Amborella trichopoda]|eukprot:XP_006857011.1 squamosa promoter-binding-like protein 7 [Amborella trichopoda]